MENPLILKILLTHWRENQCGPWSLHGGCINFAGTYCSALLWDPSNLHALPEACLPLSCNMKKNNSCYWAMFPYKGVMHYPTPVWSSLYFWCRHQAAWLKGLAFGSSSGDRSAVIQASALDVSALLTPSLFLPLSSSLVFPGSGIAKLHCIVKGFLSTQAKCQFLEPIISEQVPFGV